METGLGQILLHLPTLIGSQVKGTMILFDQVQSLGQQNNSLGLCLSQKFSNLRWLPVLCNQKKPFVCEWEEVVAPSTTISPKPTCPNGMNWFKYAPTNKCYYFVSGFRV